MLEADPVTQVLFSTDAGRPRPVRQADGPQRPAVDRRLPPAARRPARRPRRDPARPRRAWTQGGRFGYRFVFPAMRVGPWEVYWHRPLVAYLSPGRHAGAAGRRPARLPDGLPGRRARPGPAGRAVAALARPASRTGRPSSCSPTSGSRAGHRPRSTSASCSSSTRCSAPRRCRGPSPAGLPGDAEGPDARRVAGRRCPTAPPTRPAARPWPRAGVERLEPKPAARRTTPRRRR